MTALRWLLVLASVAFVLPASAQDGLRSNRPMGFFGEGHEANHGHYRNLYNADGGSCCDGNDCRPSQARWNGTTWDIMVNGEWRTMSPLANGKVLTPEVFAAQGRQRWDSQAHVCTNFSGTTIYCIIPPGPGG